MENPRFLNLDDSPWGFSARSSPFVVVFGQNRSRIAHLAIISSRFQGPLGVFAIFTYDCSGVFRKSTRGFHDKMLSLVLGK